MPSLTVWKFDSPGGAASAGARIDTLAKAGTAHLVDGAMVEWAESQTKPQTTRLMGRFAKGTMGKAFWGELFGQLLSKAEPEEGHGDVPESLRQFGVDAAGIAHLRKEITQGSSVLFLIGEQGDRDRIVEAFGGASRSVDLIFSDLPADQERQLRAAFMDTR